jgi:hypothetical protein
MAVIAGLCGATSASAHHSGAMFDRTKEITLTGTVKEVQWTNPHAWLEVMVPDQTGKPVQWGIEFGGGPQALIRIGFTRSNVKAGDKVTVLAHPLRDGRPGGSFMSVTLADGKVLKDGKPGTGNGRANPVVNRTAAD